MQPPDGPWSGSIWQARLTSIRCTRRRTLVRCAFVSPIVAEVQTPKSHGSRTTVAGPHWLTHDRGFDRSAVPKRSNQFQRLIVSIHHALAGDRAAVEESRELRDRVTGRLREVDIVIESAVGDYPVFVCIECCDRSRPATVEWVEQQHGKHANLPTNKLILVSRSGFTQSALDKARLYNIETLAIADAAAAEWTTLVGRVHQVVVDATSVVLMLFPCLQPRPKDPACPPLSFDDVLISPEGAWRVPVSRFVDTLLNYPPIRTRTVEAIAAGADAGWIVSFPVAAGSFVETVKGRRRSLGGLGLVVLTKRRIVPFNLSPIGFGCPSSGVRRRRF
jgi:hypothetical protein